MQTCFFSRCSTANSVDQEMPFHLPPCRHRCLYWKLKCLPVWLSGSLELKSFLASSSSDPREVILTCCLCTQPSISELDSLKPWNTTAILLCPVQSLIIVKLNYRWNLKGFIQPLSSKTATKKSSEYLPHAVFIYSPKNYLEYKLVFEPNFQRVLRLVRKTWVCVSWPQGCLSNRCLVLNRRDNYTNFVW